MAGAEFSDGSLSTDFLVLHGITIVAKGRHRRESKNKKQETKRFSTFAVYRLRHSETKKKHCLIRESSFSGACAKEPINNLSQVTWLCTWLPK